MNNTPLALNSDLITYVEAAPDTVITLLNGEKVGGARNYRAGHPAGAYPAIGRIAKILREHSCAVRIEGHTDNVPIRTAQFASNWELSTARATGLVKVLVEQQGISPDRVSAAGYAEFHPVAANDTAKGRQLNRRVDVCDSYQVMLHRQACSSGCCASLPSRASPVVSYAFRELPSHS